MCPDCYDRSTKLSTSKWLLQHWRGLLWKWLETSKQTKTMGKQNSSVIWLWDIPTGIFCYLLAALLPIWFWQIFNILFHGRKIRVNWNRSFFVSQKEPYSRKVLCQQGSRNSTFWQKSRNYQLEKWAFPTAQLHPGKNNCQDKFTPDMQ